MKRGPWLILLVAPVAAAGLLRSTCAGPERGAVDALDHSFQYRFATIDGRLFGISRIPRVPEHQELARLKAETADEKAAVADLQRGGWDGAFWVAGQRASILAKSYETKKDQPLNERWTERVISKPIVLTGAPPRAALPSAAALLPYVGRSFAAFEKADSYEFTTGAWQVSARPLRASTAACLKCHQQDESGRKLQLGDVIGVAMYGLTRGAAGDQP